MLAPNQTQRPSPARQGTPLARRNAALPRRGTPFPAWNAALPERGTRPILWMRRPFSFGTPSLFLDTPRSAVLAAADALEAPRSAVLAAACGALAASLSLRDGGADAPLQAFTLDSPVFTLHRPIRGMTLICALATQPISSSRATPATPRRLLVHNLPKPKNNA